MIYEFVFRITLYRLLHDIDRDMAEQVRSGRCPHCGGPLHAAPYGRKPRGGPAGIPEEFCVRLSLCCGREGCRRRALPRSCLFLGRKVYWGGIVMVVTALRQQRRGGWSIRKLRETFGMSYSTILRWEAFYREAFAKSRRWKELRGLLSSRVRSDELPLSLVEHFMAQGGDGMQRFVELLCFVAVGGAADLAQAG